jgi:hypothetical protein
MTPVTAHVLAVSLLVIAMSCACHQQPRHQSCGLLVFTYRADGARALEIAAAAKQPRVGWTLLCHGAQAVPKWARKDGPRTSSGGHIAFESMDAKQAELASELLVYHAVSCDDAPW